MESAKNLNRMEITIPYHGINLDLASFQYNLSALSKEKTSAKQSAKTSRKSSAAKENLKKIAHDYQIALPKLNPAPSIPIQTQISFPRQAKNHSKHSWILLGIFIISIVIYSLITDFQKKISMKSREIDLEVQICVKEYFDNKCSPEERIPIANQFCLEREKCINRSPENDILILHVGAELFGEFLNKFVETMTMKTIIFTIAISFGLIAMLLKYIEIRHNYKFNKFK